MLRKLDVFPSSVKGLERPTERERERLKLTSVDVSSTFLLRTQTGQVSDFFFIIFF
jgi:hypothetical protein